MLAKLIARIKAEESAVGKKLIFWLGKVGIASAAVVELLNYLMTVYAGTGRVTPQWVSTTIIVCSGLGFIAGKLTKSSSQDTPEPKTPA